MTTIPFRSTEILLPNTRDMARWSVIACDQFTSDPAYWGRTETFVGSAPSTLRMMLPEAYLARTDEAAEAHRINAVMAQYLDSGVFSVLPDSYIYLERTITGGVIRRGLLGAIDLDAYDYRPGVLPPVCPTEGIVAERLPARVKIRAEAPLEMPHIMLFIDDPSDCVIGAAGDRVHDDTPLYDFELIEQGGHLCGWAVSGAERDRTEQTLRALGTGRGSTPLLAVGDGNHSLAAAKRCWEQISEGLSEAERAVHPARYCLAELVNLHDAAIIFEPIHRALVGTQREDFAAGALEWLSAFPGSEMSLTLVSGAQEIRVDVGGLSFGELVAETDRFVSRWLAEHGGQADYVHGDAEAAAMGRSDGGAAILLPPMQKTQLFPGLVKSGPLPKKSFSVGHARDKRYYLECRRIR